MYIGATMKSGDIEEWKPKLNHNMWMRVFPNSNGIPPTVPDKRYDYAKEVGMPIVFVSSKVCCKYKGDADEGFDLVMKILKDLVDTGSFEEIWYTEHHEPENDFLRQSDECNPQRDENGKRLRGPEAYRRAINQAIRKVDDLEPKYREKIKVGPVLTRQWTENVDGRSYEEFDPGTGDFFGVDMYGNGWSRSDRRVATELLDAVSFTSKFKSYQPPGDHRIRCFPELGYIGLPADRDGTMRGDWLQRVYNEVSTWNTSTTGWEFKGFIWWNAEGTSGDPLGGDPGVGKRRWFQLDRRHNGLDYCFSLCQSWRSYHPFPPPCQPCRPFRWFRTP